MSHDVFFAKLTYILQYFYLLQWWNNIVLYTVHIVIIMIINIIIYLYKFIVCLLQNEHKET